jgi:hypothetical protein
MLSSTDNIVPKKQRALILGGGGALGAYEAGAIKALAIILWNETRTTEAIMDFSLIS